MRTLKITKLSSIGRKTFVSLALFAVVFAIASVIKIQAGTSQSASGWMWGGTDDGSGNNTGVGWISANNLDTGGSVDFGLNIPSGSGDVSGYVWSENIGWISFNPEHIVGCPHGMCKAVREGNDVRGWARILGIKTEHEKTPSNSGGWKGWVSLSGTGYGLKIDTANQKFADGSYAWTDELGWIDFSRVKIQIIPYITLTPSSFVLGSIPRELTATIHEAVPNNQVITFSKTGANPDKFNLSAASCTVNSAGSCKINVSAVDQLAAYTTIIKGDSPGFTPGYSDGTIIKLLNCSVSCPSAVEISPGGSKNISPSCSGVECGSFAINMCSGSGPINVSGPSANACSVSASAGAKFGDSATVNISTNCGSCSAKILFKRLWIETN